MALLWFRRYFKAEWIDCVRVLWWSISFLDESSKVNHFVLNLKLFFSRCVKSHLSVVFLYCSAVQQICGYFGKRFGYINQMFTQTHPPYPLDGFCLQWCGSVMYGTTAPVRYYPSTALVLLWSSVPCRHRSRPLPSSPGLHSGSSLRLAMKNWKTEANLAENGWGWLS